MIHLHFGVLRIRASVLSSLRNSLSITQHPKPREQVAFVVILPERASKHATEGRQSIWETFMKLDGELANSYFFDSIFANLAPTNKPFEVHMNCIDADERVRHLHRKASKAMTARYNANANLLPDWNGHGPLIATVDASQSREGADTPLPRWV